MARERCGVGHDDVVTNQAIVRDVCLRHQEAIVTSASDTATAPGAAVNRDEFADAIAAADLSLSIFAGKFQILRRQANRDKRMMCVSSAYARAAVDHNRASRWHAVPSSTLSPIVTYGPM